MAGRAKKRNQVKNGYAGRISDLHYDRYFDQSAVAGGYSHMVS